MGATYPRVKVWVANEDLLFSDLNAEFDNLLNNHTPQGMDDYSATVTQMRAETSPGAQSSESLATSLSGELERLRFVVRRLIGGTYWYDAPTVTLSEANTLLSQGNTIPTTRIVSGKVRSAASDQPIFLDPDGTAATVLLRAATTNFKIRIDGTEYTFTADTSLTGMSLAPSTNNTATVNDAALTGQADSKYAGQNEALFPTLTVSGAGSEITALVGKFAAFQVGTEHFLGFVKSATEITKCFRGFFFDSADAPFVRTVVSNGATITLRRLVWVLARTDLTLATLYTNPTYAYDQPTSPGSGDYWFDLNNQTWKTFNGASFVAANAALIGIAVTNTTGCVAARSFDFFNVYDTLSTLDFERIDNDTVRSKQRGGRISVYGNVLDFGHDLIEFETALDLDTGVTDAANAQYYLYITRDGDTVISDEQPYSRDNDLRGYYHPYHAWRAVAKIANDGSSNLDANTLHVYSNIRFNSVTQDRLAPRVTGTSVLAGGVAISSSSGSFTTTSSSYVDVTNLSVTLQTTGRPVRIMLIAQSGVNSRVAFSPVGSTSTGWIRMKLVRDSTDIAEFDLRETLGGGALITSLYWSLGSVQHLDAIGAGTYTYKLQVQMRAGGSSTADIIECKLVAYEI